MRVFDNPNHPAYGPVRRTWVILAGLGLLGRDAEYHERHNTDWDRCMAGGIEEGLDENMLKRLIVRRLLYINDVLPQLKGEA